MNMLTFNENLQWFIDADALQVVLNKKLRLFYQEYYLQNMLGIDYLSTDATTIKTQVANQLVTTNGVTSVASVSVTKTGRELEIEAVLNTIYGVMNVNNT